jgi:hypothetical protein
LLDRRMRLLTRTAAAATLAAALALAWGAVAEARIVVSPEPNTPDASPQTQISFLGASATELGAVSVSGSRSGVHSGRLVAYASSRGAGFAPDRPFADGERVTVTAARAGLRFQFTVVASAPVPTGAPVSAAQADSRGAWNFRSSPLHPPSVRVTLDGRGTFPGDIFVAPIHGSVPSETFAGQPGPLILDGNGKPVWIDPMPRGVWAMDFRPQTYHGAPVLTWWQGKVSAQGIGTGADVILDSSYREVAVLGGANGYRPDLHEFLLTSQGAAWVTAYRAITKNVTAYHGSPSGRVWDSVVQEIDVQTGQVMFEWHPLAHISLRESYTVPTSGYIWDPYHVNSIDVDSNGNVLLCARNTWGVYLVRPSDGSILWRLGGRHSTFKLGRGARFAWQHDARFRPNAEISLFDDEATPPEAKLSRGMIVRLDTTHRTATLVHQYTHSGVLTGSQGNQEVLPNGDAFEGWGGAPFFSEFSRGGRLLFDAHFHGAARSYRAYRAPWTGHPLDNPALAVRRTRGAATVYASWNGATEVASWRLLAGPDPAHLAPAGRAARGGFETSIASRSGGPYFAVQALDPRGDALGTSATVRG